MRKEEKEGKEKRGKEGGKREKNGTLTINNYLVRNFVF